MKSEDVFFGEKNQRWKTSLAYTMVLKDSNDMLIIYFSLTLTYDRQLNHKPRLLHIFRIEFHLAAVVVFDDFLNNIQP